MMNFLTLSLALAVLQNTGMGSATALGLPALEKRATGGPDCPSGYYSTLCCNPGQQKAARQCVFNGWSPAYACAALPVNYCRGNGHLTLCQDPGPGYVSNESSHWWIYESISLIYCSTSEKMLITELSARRKGTCSGLSSV